MTIKIRRCDVNATIAEAQRVANRTRKTQYVGGILFRDSVSLGFTDDEELLAKSGQIVVVVKPDSK